MSDPNTTTPEATDAERLSIRADLVRRVAAHLQSTGESEQAFGRRLVNDHRMVRNLRDGKVTLATIEKIEAALVARVEAAE